MLEKKPLVSIITINKNNQAGLYRTISSLQTLRNKKDIEFIFVDGLSSDKSLDVATRFYYPSEIRSEKDYGIYDAMNKGAYRANGKYLLWLNSGDELISEAMPKVERLLRDSDASIVCFGQMLVTLDKPETPIYAKPNPGALPWVVIHHQSAFFLRDTVLKLKGYNSSYKISGDQDLILRIFFSGYNIIACDEAVSRFYEGGISSSHERIEEDLKLLRSHGLIGPLRYFWRRLRLLNEPLFGGVKRLVIGGV